MQLLSKIKEILSICAEFLRQYRKYIIGACGLIVLMLVFFLAGVPAISRITREVRTSNTKNNTTQTSIADSFSTRTIDSDDMFLLEEPDFFPNIILNREPQSWSAKDVETFWTDPLQKGSEQWQEEMKKTLDKLMENIP